MLQGFLYVFGGAGRFYTRIEDKIEKHDMQPSSNFQYVDIINHSFLFGVGYFTALYSYNKIWIFGFAKDVIYIFDKDENKIVETDCKINTTDSFFYTS